MSEQLDPKEEAWTDEFMEKVRAGAYDQPKQSPPTPEEAKYEEIHKRSIVRWFFTDAIEQGTMPVFFNGHNSSALYDAETKIRYQRAGLTQALKSIGCLGISKYDPRLLEIPNGFRFDRPIRVSDFGDECHLCGSKLVAYTDGSAVWMGNPDHPCPFPDGIQSYSVEIDIVSGELLFANDLRAEYPVNDDFDVNLVSEQIRCSQAYAEAGLIHMYVGNTCPGVYQADSPDTLVVGNSPRKANQSQVIKKLYQRRHGSICTDLWWVSICDLADYLARSGETKETYLVKTEDTIVSVRPGRWRATCFSHVVSRNRGMEGHPYLILERCGEVRDGWRAIREWPFRPVEEELQIHRLAYPNLFPTRTHLLAYMFCTIGGSFGWHDGLVVAGGNQYHQAAVRFANGDRAEDDPEAAPVIVHELYSSSALCQIPDDAHPEYLRLALEIADYLLSGKGKDPLGQKAIRLAENAKQRISELLTKTAIQS
ncbi:MAG: hypothetical protein K1Y36_30215 [Blastocatellia bacterium]|nr:hypothetical protein [Blastocatellia bacterium]